MKAIFNWSGGKDSSLALYKVLQEGKYELTSLLTTLNEKHRRISMHGVREELLDLQADSLGFPLEKLWLPETPSMEEYNSIVEGVLGSLKKERISHSVFGDIFLEDLRDYREKQSAKAGLTAVFPLWNRSTETLAEEFIDLGFKAIVVCVNARYLDRSFAGRIINRQFLSELPGDVDPCGENGEYHSFVFDGPIFRQPVPFRKGEIVYREYETDENVPYDTGFYYCDLLP